MFNGGLTSLFITTIFCVNCFCAKQRFYSFGCQNCGNYNEDYLVKDQIFSRKVNPFSVTRRVRRKEAKEVFRTQNCKRQTCGKELHAETLDHVSQDQRKRSPGVSLRSLNHQQSSYCKLYPKVKVVCSAFCHFCGSLLLLPAHPGDEMCLQ